MYAVAVESAFLGPLGVAIMLGLVAYWFTQQGKSLESTPVELWARRCVFGKKEGKLGLWDTPAQAGDAVAALNAALLGFSIDVGFENEWDTVSSVGDVDVITASHQTLDYRIVMPNFDAVTSAYAYTVEVTRRGGARQVLAGDQKNIKPLARIQPPPNGKTDYVFSTAKVGDSESFKSGDSKVVIGKIHLRADSKIIEVAVRARFYRDRMDEYGFAEMMSSEILK